MMVRKCGMIEFQIWSQNLNRMTFDPLFLLKKCKNSKLKDFASFCFAKKAQMLPNFNSENRCEIL